MHKIVHQKNQEQMHNSGSKIAKLLMAAGILLCLLQVWLPAYYPNCDGPCHLSNATIISDMWRHPGSIYHHYYTFNANPNPNWLNEIILAMLQLVFRNVIAEKVLLTAYILLMVLGITSLLRKMGRPVDFWMLGFPLLIMHNALPQGFYNFTFSMAFYLLLINAWLSFLDERRWQSGVGFIILMGLTYFSHPVSFVYGCFTCVALWLSYVLASALPRTKDKLLPILLLAASVLPFILMFLGFADRQGGLEEIKTDFYPKRLSDMAAFKPFLNYSHKEEDVLIAAGITFIMLFVLFWFFRLRAKPQVSRFDGFALSFLFAFITYLILPDAMLGGGYFALRSGIYTIVLLFICCSYINIPAMVRHVSGMVVFGLFVILFFIRMPVIFKASDSIEDHMSAAPYIKPGAVLLPLNYDGYGVDRQGKTITSRNNIFCHMAQYLTDIPNTLILDNFEANTGYFPLNWRPDKDPYVHLGRWPGLQSGPPAADIRAYFKQSGIWVDNVLIMNLNDTYKQHETSRALVAEIEHDYHIVYKSATGRTILYERNKEAYVE